MLNFILHVKRVCHHLLQLEYPTLWLKIELFKALQFDFSPRRFDWIAFFTSPLGVVEPSSWLCWKATSRAIIYPCSEPTLLQRSFSAQTFFICHLLSRLLQGASNVYPWRLYASERYIAQNKNTQMDIIAAVKPCSLGHWSRFTQTKSERY